ncbi:hypothetical protein GCM10029976_056580 [Kribbella albertanoniae]
MPGDWLGRGALLGVGYDGGWLGVAVGVGLPGRGARDGVASCGVGLFVGVRGGSSGLGVGA